MLSNRTAYFKTNEKEEKIKCNNNKKYVKLNSTPIHKFDMNFHFKDEKVNNETSNFSFKNDLLSEYAYEFLKRKDESLACIILDDSIPTKN